MPLNVFARASDKISVFRRATAAIGLANALRLELSRVIYRLGLAGFCPVFTFSLPNNQHKLRLRTGTSDYNVLLHIFLFQTYEPCLPSEYAPKLIIDCGANVGYSASYFLNKFPAARVVAVEPDPGNAAMCEMNLDLYGSRVTVLKSAVWSHCCSLELVRFGPHREQSTQVRESSTFRTTSIQALDIPTLFELCGGGTVDLLKVDIEGSELQLFTDSANIWLPKVRNIAIELHGQECREAFFRALGDYDYELVNFGDTTICRNIAPRCQTTKADARTPNAVRIERNSGTPVPCRSRAV